MTRRKERGRRGTRTTKSRVLQARIPEDLDDQLRVRSEQLGLSVSTIVRNVLQHTFELVEGVVTDSAQVGRALQGQAAAHDQAASPPAQEDQDTEVVGWQEAVLNLNGTCEQCNVILPRGKRAAVGIPLQRRPIFLCLECLEGFYQHEDEQAEEDKPAPKPRRRTKNADK